MLGFRDASRYLDPGFQDGFELECCAIKRVREDMGLSNIQLMVPFGCPQSGWRIRSKACSRRRGQQDTSGHRGPSSTRLQGVKEALVLLYPQGVRNRSSCLSQVRGRNGYHHFY